MSWPLTCCLHRWKEALDLIKEQRKTLIAPVDTMGCDEAGKLEDEQDRPDSDARVRALLLHGGCILKCFEKSHEDFTPLCL